jgi:hypothetical protein
MYARLGPRGSKTTTSAVSVRGTVEMLIAPKGVKVSTDKPSQLYSLRLANQHGDMPPNAATRRKMTTSSERDEWRRSQSGYDRSDDRTGFLAHHAIGQPERLVCDNSGPI